MHRTIRLLAVGALTAGVVVALPASSALAQTETVLTGVDNGRGVLVAPDGSLWVASSGVGDPAYTSEGFDTEAATCVEGPEGAPSCYGETGAILTVPDASAASNVPVDASVEFLSGLPSHAGMNGAQGLGPADLSLGADGLLYYTMGLGADPAVRQTLIDDGGANAGLFATLRSVDPTDDTTDAEVADLGDFEAANNPDEVVPDTNPFGVFADTDASIVTVLDSGGNDVLEVALPGGGVTAPAVLPPTAPVPLPPFVGAPSGANATAQAVPTGLAALTDGTFAVGQLTGFPFAPGAAGVWNYDGDSIEPRYLGFTNIIDVAEGPDGALYVLEIAHDGLLAAEGGPPLGALIRVTDDGGTVTRELLLDDVIMPGGMAFDPTDVGMLYMTSGAAGPDGTVERFDTSAAEPLLTVVDDAASTDEDHRLVAGDANEDQFTTVVADVMDNDTGVTSVTPLNTAQGAVAEGSIVYQPPAHFTGDDVVPYRACNDSDDCVNGVLTVTVEETPTDRIAGETRVLTAVEASMGRYPDGAPAVLLARSDLYPDALAGGPLAAALGAPILLTSGDGLDEATAAEIQRLAPAAVWVLGGPVAISDGVVGEVEAIVADTQRIEGENRFATAVAIKDKLAEVGDAATTAYVVEGYDPDPNRGWPDAVAVSALASFEGQPILLAETDRLPDETADALAGIDATVVGGPVAISDVTQAAIDAAADTVDEISGETRFGTSTAVAEAAMAAGMDSSFLSLVSGGNWPDALVAGPLVAGDGGSFVLVHPTDLASSPETVAFVQDNAVFDDVDLFGGPVAISSSVEAGIATANE